MDITGIEYIKKSIRTHLEDLHLMFLHDAVSIDIEYYNEVNLVLLEAEDRLKIATRNHEKRIKDHFDKYGNPNLTID